VLSKRYGRTGSILSTKLMARTVQSVR
jgi:hypothetical protein